MPWQSTRTSLSLCLSCSHTLSHTHTRCMRAHELLSLQQPQHSHPCFPLLFFSASMWKNRRLGRRELHGKQVPGFDKARVAPSNLEVIHRLQHQLHLKKQCFSNQKCSQRRQRTVFHCGWLVRKIVSVKCPFMNPLIRQGRD